MGIEGICARVARKEDKRFITGKGRYTDDMSVLLNDGSGHFEDGSAAADLAAPPRRLQVIGEAPAGGSFDGRVEAGQAVRIFTGGPVPEGADAIVIQEDTDRLSETEVDIREAVPQGHYVRPAGLDFAAGEVLLEKGRLLSARDIALAGAMNIPWLMVHRRPRVAILATGDEIVMPCEPIGPNQIVSSNSIGLSALATALGCEPRVLGIARDDADSLRNMASGAGSADILVTTGGASVGDHDLIQSVLGDVGLDVDFWRIAMRPGKPLIFGELTGTPLLGLPGNPVSALVCALVFLLPALDRMAGLAVSDLSHRLSRARLGAALPVNDRRQDFLRATLSTDGPGLPVVTAFGKQDSSMLSRLARSDALIMRAPHAPAAEPGEEVEILRFPAGRLQL